jgi:hypothetical protein
MFAMTRGGTQKIYIQISIIETGDMPQKVLFDPFLTHLRQVTEPPCQKKIENVILMCAMGSCIKVVLKRKFDFLLKKKLSAECPIFKSKREKNMKERFFSFSVQCGGAEICQPPTPTPTHPVYAHVRLGYYNLKDMLHFKS